MDSHKSLWASEIFKGLWPAGQEEDVYEVESMVPLPEPYPFTFDLNDRNAIVVNTSISHINHRRNGHILKVVSKISLPTPPYSLAHAKASQTELVRESIKRKQETTELLRCQEELQERLNEEAKAREHLALELSKAEGLLDGYSDEKVFLEKQMQEKNDLIRHLEQELQSTGNRLQELEQERQQIQEEKELLSRQKRALKADAAPAEQRLVEAAVVAAPKEELLEETEKLLMEKIEVQRQAEKDSGDLNKQVKVLEVELEDQVNRFVELEQEKNADLEDLRQKNISLEKQLEKTRRFLDEQAVDREHERDVFQQEIQKLEEQLKIPQRHQPVPDDQSNEVEKLESNLKEKTDKCSELLLCKEQLQRDVQERNEEMEKLEGRIRELEQALIISSDSLQKVEDRRPSIVVGLKGEMPLEAQLQVEREATDRKEKEVTNLVEQLEQFREELENKNEEVQQLHMQLEIQRKESDTRLQELEQKNNVLKGESESTKQVHPETFTSKGPHPILGKTEELLLLRDQEIDQLTEQIGKLQAQLESATDNKVIEEKNEQIKEYKSQIKCLKSDQERLKKNSEEEIEKLNEVIEKLQEELSRIEQKVAVDFTEKHQYEDIADENETLEPLVDHGDTPVTKMEEENVDASKPLVSNVAAEHENTCNTDRRNEISTLPSKPLSEPEDLQVSLQNLESKLKELMDVIRKKDEQIVMLESQIQVIRDQEERVNNMAVGHENTSNTESRSEISTLPSKQLPEPEDVQVTLQNMESKLKELMDVIKEKDEQIVMLEKKNLVMKDQEETVNSMAVEHENTSNTDRRNEISTMSSLPLSEPEDLKVTLQNMESKLKELMNVIKEKDEQIVMLKRKNLVMKDQEETVNNVVADQENNSNTDRRNEISTMPSLPLSEPEDMQVSLQNMESKLKELMDIVKKKDEQIVILEKQTLSMKDLEETVKRLQTELEDKDQKFAKMQSSGDQLSSVSPEKPILPTNTEESNTDEMLSDKEVVTAKDEMQPLKEVLEKSMMSSENLVKKDANDTVSIERLTEELREKTAKYLAVEALLVSVQEASKDAIHRLEIQLQDLQRTVHERDSQILQLTNASPLLENQEIERLNDVVRKLQEKLADAEDKIKEANEGQRESLVENADIRLQKVDQVENGLENQEIERLNDVVRELQEKLADAEEKIKEAKEGQRETLGENAEILLQKVDQDESELARMKAELEKTTLEMALLERELEKHKLLHGTINLKKDEESKTMETCIGEVPVTNVEETLPKEVAEPPVVTTSIDKTSITTVKNMELQIQELQNVIHLKDAELLQYANQKDLLNRHTKEIERLNKSLEDFEEQQKMSANSDVSTKDDESQTSYIENKEVQLNSALQAELEETKTAMALLKGKLEKVKDVKTKDEVSQTYHQETCIETENVQQKVNEDDGKVLPIKAKLEKTRMEMALLEEKMAKVKLFQGSVDLNESDEIENVESDEEFQEKSLKSVLSGKAEQSKESHFVLTSMNSTKDMKLHIQQLQKIISLKDAELLQCENQKDFIKQQAQEIEQLKSVIREEGKVSMHSGATTKDGESDKTTIMENREGQKDGDGDDVLQTELQQAKMEVAALKKELGKLKESKKHTDQKIEEASSEGKVRKVKRDTEEVEWEKQTEPCQAMVTSTEETTQNIIHDTQSGLQDMKLKDASSEGESHKAKLHKRDTEEAQREKQAELSQAFMTSSEETKKNAELLQCENQKDLLKQQAQEIEELKAVIREERKVSIDSGATTKDDESQTSHEITITENREVPKDYNGDRMLQAELQQAKMEVAALRAELGKLKESKKHTDVKIEEASSEGEVHKAKLDKSDTEEAQTEKQAEPRHAIVGSTEEVTQNVSHNVVSQLQDMKIEEVSSEGEIQKAKLDKRDTEEAQAEPCQTMLTSTGETSQNIIHDMESRLKELQKVVLQKNSELQQYLNQQNVVSQQTMEIERLHNVIETLTQKLGEVELKKASFSNTEGIEQVGDEEKERRPLVNGESTITNSHEAIVEVKEDSRQLLRGKDNIDGQDPLEGKSGGDETYDDGVEETLRDKTAQRLASQVLLTSVQETMQHTIDTMESQLQAMQNVIQEKELEILLYLEEIETLKEQVKAESDQHGEMMVALEDSLREKVAAALVSDAQLKAIQAHTKELREDDRPTMLEEEEARTLQDLSAKPSAEEEAESKLSALSLRLLELEKQLSDLHEQLQVEREQVLAANQKASKKARQLRDLQKVLESSWGNVDINWTKCEPETVDPVLSQSIVIEPEDNTATDVENVLQIIKEEATATKEELCHYREMADKLQEELMVKESSLAHLDEDLREVRKCLAHAEEKLAFYMKKELQEEEQLSMSGVDFTDGVRSPEWNTKERSSSSSSQTDIVPSVNSSNQTSRVHHKNIGVQKELETARLSNTSEEVAELMECYTDKISQMQELHAAEILDMEARHITEADTLRREQYAVVQALSNECEALKAVIDALKSSGGVVPDSALSTSYHLTDAASSECDWSQGTYDAQSLDQLPEGLRVEDDVPAELIPSKIKDLLRAVHQEGMQVLSLTEATSPEKEKPFTINTQSWREERKTLIETIASLKDLIAKMQIYKEPEVHARSDFHERSPDWRGELLRAIQEVFCREQDALLSAFYTQLATLGNCDATAVVNKMQHQLQEQGIEQINAMDCIQNAERRSLLLEIQDLRAQLTSLQINHNIDSLHHTEGAALYTPQDQASLPQEMHLQLSSMKANAGDLQEQLGSERLLAAEIKNELAITKMELESTLKTQHKHFKELESLRMELKKRRDELDSVNDALANEQKKTRELQWALEKEKNKTERSDQQDKEELEDLQILFEEQKTKTLEITKRFEEEQLLLKSLQEQITSKESLHDAALAQERSKVSELQAVLDAEKTRSGELANSLERRQSIEAHMENTEGTGQTEAQNPTEELLRDLEGQLDSKHHRIVELVTETEGYKLECVQLRKNLDEERQRLRKDLETEEEATKLAKKQAEDLKSMVEDLQQQVQDKVKEIRRLQAEEKRLKETIHSLQNSERTKESGLERAELPESLASNKISAAPVRSEVHQPTGSVPNVLCPDPFSTVDGDPGAEEAAFSVDTIRRRLQHVSSKLRQLAAKATRRVMFDATDDDDFTWSQSTIQEVMSQLENVSMLSLQGQNLVLPSGISANTLTEKLLTQNAELTGYVSRLTNEKNDLQNALLRLEGEISHHRAREGDQSPQSTWDHTTSTDSLTEEREAWNREKLNLHKSLTQTEAELSKVKAELRSESIQRDLGRDTDNAALKRIYGKYLRSESFRKALVYQKKYLLLLLGGFQECEEATLALIARMGGQPSYTDLEVITKHSRAFTRFRSVARVAIAISRMKFLVRRWQRAISPVGGSANRNGQGMEVRTDSPYHPAGSVDMFVDQRFSCRSRSGFDSPQSTVNSQHRFASSDLSSCSHLQNYDPDRALTDYIARLESLQKRLGSAPSGPSTNSTTHYGIRR